MLKYGSEIWYILSSHLPVVMIAAGLCPFLRWRRIFSTILFIFYFILCFSSVLVYGTDRSKAVVLVLFLFCLALWFLLRGVLCWVLFSDSFSPV